MAFLDQGNPPQFTHVRINIIRNGATEEVAIDDPVLQQDIYGLTLERIIELNKAKNEYANIVAKLRGANVLLLDNGFVRLRRYLNGVKTTVAMLEQAQVDLEALFIRKIDPLKDPINIMQFDDFFQKMAIRTLESLKGGLREVQNGAEDRAMAAVFDSMSYQPVWLTEDIKNEIFKELPALNTLLVPIFRESSYFSSALTHVVQSGSTDYYGALDIVRNGPDFNHFNDYPKSGRAFWTNIGPWSGHYVHSPILQLSFQGQVIGQETEDKIKKQIDMFLSRNMKSVQNMLPRERFSLTKNDYLLTMYLFDVETIMNHIDAVRHTNKNPLPLDWLLIKNPKAIKDIIMVAPGVDRPDNWREEAALAWQQSKEGVGDRAMTEELTPKKRDEIIDRFKNFLDTLNGVLRSSSLWHSPGEDADTVLWHFSFNDVSSNLFLVLSRFSNGSVGVKDVYSVSQESIDLLKKTLDIFSDITAARQWSHDPGTFKGSSNNEGTARELIGYVEKPKFLKVTEKVRQIKVSIESKGVLRDWESLNDELKKYSPSKSLSPAYENEFIRPLADDYASSGPGLLKIHIEELYQRLFDRLDQVVGQVGAGNVARDLNDMRPDRTQNGLGYIREYIYQWQKTKRISRENRRMLIRYLIKKLSLDEEQANKLRELDFWYTELQRAMIKLIKKRGRGGIGQVAWVLGASYTKVYNLMYSRQGSEPSEPSIADSQRLAIRN